MREKQKEDEIDEGKNPNNPHPVFAASTAGPCLSIRTESRPIAGPDRNTEYSVLRTLLCKNIAVFKECCDNWVQSFGEGVGWGRGSEPRASRSFELYIFLFADKVKVSHSLP